jgi:hypothetical protein
MLSQAKLAEITEAAADGIERASANHECLSVAGCHCRAEPATSSAPELGTRSRIPYPQLHTAHAA